MEKEILRTVKYSSADAIKFEKIALKLGRSQRVIFTQMVDYFYRSKKDPADFNDEILKTTILKGQKEYIGFIKSQEKELLIPMKRDMTRMNESQKKIIDCFNSQVLVQNNSLLQKQQEQSAKFSQYDQLAKTIYSRMETKESLKRQFTYILDSYIKIRETFGVMTSGKEKEGLINSTYNQIKLL
jgi:hypothetical protein